MMKTFALMFLLLAIVWALFEAQINREKKRRR